jgi:hypothetical protein
MGKIGEIAVMRLTRSRGQLIDLFDNELSKIGFVART